MPIKKDETGKRWVEMEVLVPGTPEEVWSAMATGPGNTAWFTRTDVEPRVGGAIRFDLGDHGVSSGEVTMWQPPARFGYVEHGWAEGAPPVATEITIESRSGDRCVVRMVHSLFTSSDEWDDQVEGFEGGWPGFFAVLRVYLAHFAGQPAAALHAMVPVDVGSLDAWHRLVGALGLGGVNAGESRPVSVGFASWQAIVECVYQDDAQRYAVLRLTGESPGIALIGTHDAASTTSAGLCVYYYGDAAQHRMSEAEPRWRAWLAQRVARAS
jgi:uncharacterized protein YndB with AHSA1/START domain